MIFFTYPSILRYNITHFLLVEYVIFGIINVSNFPSFDAEQMQCGLCIYQHAFSNTHSPVLPGFFLPFTIFNFIKYTERKVYNY